MFIEPVAWMNRAPAERNVSGTDSKSAFRFAPLERGGIFWGYAIYKHMSLRDGERALEKSYKEKKPWDLFHRFCTATRTPQIRIQLSELDHA